MTLKVPASSFQFASIRELESFLWSSPKQDVGARDFGPRLSEWLDDGGLEPDDDGVLGANADAHASATLLVVGRELVASKRATYTVEFYAIPDEDVPSWLRRALYEHLSGATYGVDLCGDLEGVELWRAAVWLAVLCADGRHVLDQLADALDQLVRAGQPLRRDELRQRAGAWRRHRLRAAKSLRARVSGVYTICLRDGLGV